MACPIGLVCWAQGLSFCGGAIAAWQALRASQLLGMIKTLEAHADDGLATIAAGRQTDPAATAGAGTPGPTAADQIPLSRAYIVTAKSLKQDAEWTPRNHLLLVLGIGLAVLGSALSLYHAAFP
ncbi:MAG: hypothetical protein KDJ39_10490 [Gammaproteobacteria bacterium]|nr:hypothetical protein [Gammaproteobacteria bacterium]